MIGVGLFLCVLALLVIGLLAMVAWDACEYDKRIVDLETMAKKVALKLAWDTGEHEKRIARLESVVKEQAGEVTP
jgi:Tfp pilus assembly protein PilX